MEDNNKKKLTPEEMQKSLEDRDRNISPEEPTIENDPYLEQARKMKEITGKEG